LSFDKTFHHHPTVKAQGFLDRFFELAFIAGQPNPQGISLGGWLHDDREAKAPMVLHRAALLHILAVQHVAGAGRQVVEAKDLFGLGFVPGEARGQHPRPGVGDPHHLEDALQAAVFCIASAERDERQVQVGLPQHHVDVSVDEER